MMIRGLLHEIVRRRLWPIPAVAVLVAVAAPLLFLKSPSDAPQLAPQDSPVVEVSSAQGLPAGARRLLRTKPAPPRKPKVRKAADPFQAPSSVSSGTSGTTDAKKGAGGAAPSSASGSATQKPVPVVITDEDGKATTPAGDQGSEPGGRSNAGYVAVDVRFAKSSKGEVRRRLPRLTPLTAKDRIVATFVKYSPTRNKAVFAISPNTHVAGTECRGQSGLCRYVDLSSGESATLTIPGPKGSLMTRRLAVVGMRPLSGAEPRPPLAGRCLLTLLRKLGPGDQAIASDACD